MLRTQNPGPHARPLSTAGSTASLSVVLTAVLWVRQPMETRWRNRGRRMVATDVTTVHTQRCHKRSTRRHTCCIAAHTELTRRTLSRTGSREDVLPLHPLDTMDGQRESIGAPRRDSEGHVWMKVSFSAWADTWPGATCPSPRSLSKCAHLPHICVTAQLNRDERQINMLYSLGRCPSG